MLSNQREVRPDARGQLRGLAEVGIVLLGGEARGGTAPRTSLPCRSQLAPCDLHRQLALYELDVDESAIDPALLALAAALGEEYRPSLMMMARRASMLTALQSKIVLRSEGEFLSTLALLGIVTLRLRSLRLMCAAILPRRHFALRSDLKDDHFS